MGEPKIIMDKQDIDRSLSRIAHEIWERERGEGDAVFIGIRRLGVPIAQRLSQKLSALGGTNIPVGALDINLYRDDLSEIASQPVLKKTEIPFAVKDKRIILCDDVLYTGRTIRAALDSIVDMGRPRAIRLAVLIDRGYRELPIQANYVGKKVSVTKDELVELMLEEEDGIDKVIITRGTSHGIST